VVVGLFSVCYIAVGTYYATDIYQGISDKYQVYANAQQVWYYSQSKQKLIRCQNPTWGGFIRHTLGGTKPTGDGDMCAKVRNSDKA
jgi:hypothetical protein